MSLCCHITFFYIIDRIKYINRIIDETNKYEIKTDLYIHTNKEDLKTDNLNTYSNGNLNIIWHDLTKITHPFYLTWSCRPILHSQRDLYDYFMYIEDDMLVPYTAIKYWLKHSNDLIKLKYNLGFIRIETENNIEFCTDLYDEHLDTIINLNDIIYCVNNKNPYCAFWIYSKEEFNNFINSGFYQCYTINGYGTREQSAIGLHGKSTHYYKETVIPIVDNKLDLDCRIYHMPNNYVVDKTNEFATIKFDEAIKKFPFI